MKDLTGKGPNNELVDLAGNVMREEVSPMISKSSRTKAALQPRFIKKRFESTTGMNIKFNQKQTDLLVNGLISAPK